MSFRLAVDLQAAQTASALRGIGRYSLEFARAVCDEMSDAEVFLGVDATYGDHASRLVRESMTSCSRLNWLPYWYPGPRSGRGYDHSRRSLAGEMALAAYSAYGLDQLHVSSIFEGFHEHAAPLDGLARRGAEKVSVTTYDFIPLRFPDHYFKGSAGESYRNWYMRKLDALSRFDQLLCISEATRLDAIDFLGVDPARAHVIGGGVAPMFRPANDPSGVKRYVQETFGLAGRYVLYTGNDDYRKNVDGALASYSKLPRSLRRDTKLVLNQIGDPYRLAKSVRRLGLDADSVVITGRVSDEDLVALMQACDVFFFPSHFEGFGLPVVEAMACGVPVLCAANSSLLEVAPLREMTFDSADVATASSLLELALTDEAFGRELVQAGLEAAQRHTWKSVATKARAAWSNDGRPSIGSFPESPPVSPGSRTALKLALLTPLPPAQTGVADYSAELIRALKSMADLVVFSDDVPTTFVDVEVEETQRLLARRDEFDCVIYNIGNSPFHSSAAQLLEVLPGIVILHDFFLSSMIWHRSVSGGRGETFREVLEREHGLSALATHDDDDWAKESARRLFPCSLSILKGAEAIVSHSRASKALASQHYRGTTRAPWYVLPMPIARVEVSLSERAAARKRLGLSDECVLVVSLGFVADTKLSVELAEACRIAAEKLNRPLVLRLVGGCGDAKYRSLVESAIRGPENEATSVITGFVPPETYTDYLLGADLAVQLRRDSRGETSKAQLDCMAFGVPCIVNKHGALGEVPDDCAFSVPEFPSVDEISSAVITLVSDSDLARGFGARASAYVAEKHLPSRVALDLITVAQRSIARRRTVARLDLIAASADAVQDAEPSSANDELWAIEHALRCISNAQKFRRLVMDVSDMHATDYGTGIHRVVREFARHLALQASPASWQFDLCVHDRSGEARLVTDLESSRLKLPVATSGSSSRYAPGECWGDVLLLADSCWENPERFEGTLRKVAARQGLSAAIVYDLIPITNPEHCVDYMPAVLSTWLTYVVEKCDLLLCISQATTDELAAWIDRTGVPRALGQQISVIELGSDIRVADDAGEVLSTRVADITGRSDSGYIVMLGTVEPRKRHDVALDAFDELWAKSSDVSLVIVGKPGWNTEQIQARIQGHPESGRRLHWLADATDSEVAALLKGARLLLQCSDAEGYGLPVAEASRFGIRLILSDIAVFREVAGDSAHYFPPGDPVALAAELSSALNEPATHGAQGIQRRMPTWNLATQALLSRLMGVGAP